MLRVASLCVALAMVLTACGSSQGDRAASGAGIGAAGGAVVGAVTGLTIVEGALIGAAVGGVTGVLTDEEDVNLGEPVWGGDEQASGGNNVVTRVQGGLAQLGYNPGPVDGAVGPQTAEAIRAYQRDHGLLVDGQASTQLAEHIEQRL